MKTIFNSIGYGDYAQTGTIEGKFKIRVPWLDGKFGQYDYENAVITIDRDDLKDALKKDLSLKKYHLDRMGMKDRISMAYVFYPNTFSEMNLEFFGHERSN